MAFKIDGDSNVSIKSLKFYPDHEGCFVPYGNIYFKDKKVGNFRDDGWGGCIDFNFINIESENLVKKEVSNILKNLGFRSPKDASFKPLMADMEEYINLITDINLLVSSLKKRQKKIINDFKKKFKNKSISLNQLEEINSMVFVLPVNYKTTDRTNHYYFEINTSGWIVLPKDVNSFLNKCNKEDIIVTINSEGIMTKIQ